MAIQPQAPPVLSSPESQIFDTYTPAPPTRSKLSDEALYVRYEIQRTVDEIRGRRWRRIALQFPDHMLPDAPRVCELLGKSLRSLPRIKDEASVEQLEHEVRSLDMSRGAEDTKERLYILGDTSYGACCVDEIAAEHVSADSVVHYGRACLSPTSRLPVLHIFTIQPLDSSAVVAAFESAYPDKSSQVILTADVTYSSHIDSLYNSLVTEGYTNVFAASIVHEPSSPIPNRTVPPQLIDAPEGISLQDWSLFHISQPPASLLLTLASRLSSINVYPTAPDADLNTTPSTIATLARSMPLLRRRYALLTKLRTASILGILINTLSVSSTMPMLERINKMIAAARKKSYTVVVGKVNAAKLANFAEVDGWVVIGCWESSLLDDDEGRGGAGWWKPCVTPWELEIALGEEGAWRGNWSANLDLQQPMQQQRSDEQGQTHVDHVNGDGPLDEDEDEPPEFDLRTGRYVSNTRPMRTSNTLSAASSKALAKRAKGDLATINGVASPGAGFLRDKRTWQGLGSDFEIAYEDEKGAGIEQGRGGIARGYVGEPKP